MSEPIVTGVDGSETAARAARAAARMASALDAELVVVCAYRRLEVERVQAGAEEFIFSTDDAAERVAEKVVRELVAEHPGLRARAATEQGKPDDALVRVADRVGAQLIVVGNKRVQGVARVLGSVAAGVAQRAPCDVYVANTTQPRP
jgi:nucleotide-binding universal stress UspA family protein